MNSVIRTALAGIIFLLLSVSSRGQDKSNQGKEFWLGYGYGWNFQFESPTNTQELVLYLSAEAPANVTVSVTNTSWSQTVSIPANTVDASIRIPKTGAADARMFNEGLHNKGIHIVSDTPIVVYAHVYNNMLSAATMLMPVETYGYRYFSLNYSQALSGSQTPHPPAATTQNGPDWYSYFYVVASEDNTRLQITPSDTTRNGWLPGQTYTVNLNKGEIYNVMGKLSPGNLAWQASKDMTGSKVVSVPGGDGNCHPFALFSGSSGIRLCRNDGGETMMQQVFPTQAWGTRYLTYHTLNNTNTDINEPFKNFYRIAVSDPATVVRRNGVVMTGLQRNFYYEIVDSTGGDYIESDQPVLVAQYTPNFNACWKPPPSIGGTYGDPEMFYLSPLEQGKKDVLFYATRNAFVDYNYVNVIVPTPAVASLRLDGNPFAGTNIIPHPRLPSYSVAVARIPGAAAQHRLTCDSNFTATLYGLGYYESYGYNVGTRINNLNNYGVIRNTLNTNGQTDTFTCPRSPFRMVVKLAYPATSITWKLSQVPGLFPNTDSVISNPVPVGTELINNRLYYLYTLQQDFTLSAPGRYTIPVSYTASVIENCAQTELASFSILVKPGPAADFTIGPQQCLTDTVRFTGTTPAGLFNLTTYLWTFDDGSTQNTRDARKRFATTGPHPVQYRVTADNGCIGDTTKTVTIINGTGTPLNITVSGRPCRDSLLTFTSSQLPNAANPTTWWWDFGNGQTTSSTTSNVATQAYASAATGLVVKHLATLTTGCNPDTVRLILPVIHDNPTAVFTLTADTFCINKPVQYSSPLTGISQWNWNFGNGTGTQSPPFVRPFSTPGTFNVSLRVTDVNGCGSSAFSQPITIHPPPPVNAGPDKLIPFGSSVTLEASLANASAYILQWTPPAFLDNPGILNPVSTPDRLMIYTLQATDRTTFCTASDQVTVNPITDLYIPTAFTPNNDGRNDRWNIPGLALYPNAVVSVFNRWGEKIVETKNYTGRPWDGTWKGQLQPAGVYVYFIRLNDEQNRSFKGTVTLIW